MAVRQMTAKTLNALKGWPNPAAVDFTAELSAAALALRDPVPPGVVVHVSSDLQFDLGVGTLSVMPLFLFNGSDDFDVANTGGGDAATEKGVWVPINPTGQAMALPAVGAYELVSTAFDTAQDYPPNTPLTAGRTGATAGNLTPGTLYTDMVVGIVSRGVVNNGYGHDAVAFWPCPVFPS